jgi:hypothetical protein
MPELLTRGAPTSVDTAGRTATVVLSTFADVQRTDARGPYVERLAPTIDPATLAGKPVLDSHRRDGLERVLGTVRRAWLEAGNLMAELAFSPRADAILADLASGILRSVSIGFSVQKWREIRDEAGRRIREATDWRIAEVSLVPIGADGGAVVREELAAMPETRQADQPATPPETDPTTTAAATVVGRAAVNRQIRASIRAAGLDPATADGLIDRAATVEEARAAIFDALVTRGEATPIRTASAGQHDRTLDDPMVFRDAVAEALVHRVAGGELSGPARGFAGWSIPDVARQCLERAGERILSRVPGELVARAVQSTSDFPEILANTVNRSMRARLASAPRAAITLARKSTNKDFRAKIRLQLSGAPLPLPVGEGGEYRHGGYIEAAEAYQLARFGRIIAFSVEVLANDDVGAFSDVSGDLASGWLDMEDLQIVKLVEANPTMRDGKAVFHSGHGNLAASGGVLSELTLSAGRLAMRSQKGLEGRPINVAPAVLLVPPALETLAEKLLTTIQPATTGDANPFSKLRLVVDARLSSATAWYLVADPAMGLGIEYASVEGFEGPRVTSERDFDTSGLRVKVEGSFGAGFIDFRGWYRNAGG